MRVQIEKIYPQSLTNGCIQQRTDSFDVYDHRVEHRCYIKTDLDEPSDFTIKNKGNKEIHFLAIDKCLFHDTDTFERCDCAVFNENEFCFIEIKESNLNQRQENKKKATGQLRATISKFKGTFDLSGYVLEAYRCIGIKEPSPRIPASGYEARVDFNDNLGVLLYDGNIKEFI